jgi:FG-GAP-like repeat/Domain of unknown function (DUF4214)
MPLRKMIDKFQQKWSRRAPKPKSRRRLELELLETRDLMAVTIAPKIISINPPDGASVIETAAPNVIKVQYSEAMNVAEASNTANYLLFGPAGIAVPITSVVEEGASNTYDVTFGASSPTGVYTLFVKGDQVHEVTNKLALSPPGQLVVAAAGSGSASVSTVGVPDGFNPGAPTTLGAVQTYAMGPNAGGFALPTPVAVVVGDFNNDGNLDLAIANNFGGGFFSPNEVDIYTGKASGGFDATPAARLLLPATSGNIVSLAAYSTFGGAGNFGNNLAVLDSTNNVDVFTNSFGGFGGVPTFNPVVVVKTGATKAVALAPGDFNGDGLTDLAVLDSANIDFLPGTAGIAMPFNAARTFAIPGGLTTPTSIAVGGLRNANSQDIAIGGSNGVLTLFNNGTFAPTLGALISAPLTNITSVAIGNLDGDSGPNDAQDIAALSGASVEVLVNMDDGTGAINAALSSSFALGAVGKALALSPQNFGGKADIVVANSAANEVTVLQNTSVALAPTFLPPAHYAVDVNPLALAVGNFNGDGSPDIVTVNSSPGFFGSTGSTFSVVRNNGNGTYAVATPLTTPTTQANAIAVGDLNGDNIPDLVVANFSSNTVTVYLASNTTPGAYAAGVTYSVTDSLGNGRGVQSVTLADLTGTGKLDVVTGNTFDNTVSILANNGDGTFAAATTVAVGAGVRQVIAGKFDNTGRVSLAVAHNGGGPNPLSRGVSLLLGNGNRTFRPAQEILPGVFATAIVAGNFTSAPGAPLDLVVADGSNGTVELLRNNGKGVFTHSVNDTFAVGASPIALAAADFNRDGFQDVVAVSSDGSGGAQQIAVLLNSARGGFAAAVFTPLPFNFPVLSVAVTDVNGDAFPDLVVGLLGSSTSAPADANFYVLTGNGDGTFANPVPYQTSLNHGAVVAVAADSQVRATTFTLVSNIVAVDLIKNGGFEAHDLNGTPGNFIGWQSTQTKDSRGGFYLQSGSLSPLSQTPLPPPSGGIGANVFRAVADQSNLQPILPAGGIFFGGGNQNAPSTYSGSNFLYQDITLPASATSLTFSLDLVLSSAAQFTDGNSSLFFDKPVGAPNQQVRVDFIDPNSPITTTDTSVPGTGVLLNLFQTNSGTSTLENITITATPAQLATLLNGTTHTVRLRISVVNNQGRLTVGVDNVSLRTQFADTTPPILSGPQLRNPGFQLPGLGNQPFSTTDPTLTGSVSDNGGVANIKEVVFSPFSAAVDPNFNMAGDTIVGPAGLDATGHFSVALQGLVPSLAPITIRAKVIDNAGLSSGESAITFIYQAPSVTNFQAVGPGPINVTGVTGISGDQFTTVQFQNVVGRINAVLVDPTDRTGNTYLTAGDNGGIWRTTDGGVDWTPTTDYIFNPHTGLPINVPIGAIGGAIDQSTNRFIVYAGLGSSDRQPDSRAGNGVLISTNGGVSWALAGNSDTVLAGARISKVVVDPNNTNIAYVAVVSGGSSGPGVYKTSDGGQTWANVLTTASIQLPPPAGSFAAGTKLASVTDLVINPFDSKELTVALGNIGFGPASATAGVYRTRDGGSLWVAVTGGSRAAQRDGLPGAVDVNGVLTPAVSLTIGRITLAYAAGITNDTSTLYVLVTSPPAANPLPGGNVDFGNGKAGTVDEPLHDTSGFLNTPNIYGLYKSGNQTLGVTAFTHVQVREQKIPSGGTPDEVPWTDVNFSNVDASNSGALVVDPTDPNVVYVGGSEEYGLANATFNNHGLLRIDTGNMVDTSYFDQLQSNEGFLNTGDDITKRIAAYDPTPGPPENKFEYPTKNDQGYLGEGVSWLDVTTNAFNNDNFNFSSFGTQGAKVPPNITSVAFDSQGRIVLGTEQGIYRLVYQGTGYDFTSGGQGILPQGGFDGKQLSTATVPTSTIQLSQINGNLQISDLTSASLDPTIPGRVYTTQFNTGAAVSSGGLAFTSSGLQSGVFNPTSFGSIGGIPDGARVVVAQPDPTTPPGTINTIYEIFAFGDVGAQENFQIVSSTQGGAFQTIGNVPTAGIGLDRAGYLPVLAINPHKILQFIQPDNRFEYEDELLFGTDRIYVSRTSGAQFNPLSAGPLSSKGGLITAAAFAGSNDQVIYAATDKGEVFVTVLDPVSKGYSFKELDAGLPPGQRVNSVTVDPNNADVAYITETVTATGVGQVFRTLNGGKTWTNITGNLPPVNINTVATDPRPENGAPFGHLYVGTDVGAYVSLDGGAHWALLGVGLPHVPVVDLQFNQTLETLLVATQGRGAFEISTDQIGAHVIGVSPANPVNPVVGALTSVTVTFNKAIGSFPLSAVDFINGPNGAITPISITDVSTFPPGFPNPHNAFQISFAPQTRDGVYTIQIGPNILDLLGHPLDQNQNTINGEDPGDRFTFHVALNSTDNGQFVTGQFHDEFNRAADTEGFISILGPVDAARFALLQNLAATYVIQLGRPQVIQDLYGPSGPSVFGLGDLIQRAPTAAEVNYWLGQFQQGLSYEQMITSLTSDPSYFAEARINGNDGAFVTAIYNDLLGRTPTTFEHDTLFVPQLFNAEAASRTQDARVLLGGQPYQTVFIQGVYSQFLNRAPTNAELNFQLDQLGHGQTQEQVIAAILGSPEYYTSEAPSPLGAGMPASNATLIRSMYKQLFPGYTVSQGEVDFWVSRINNPSYAGGANPAGMSGEQIANILDTSSLYRFGATGVVPTTSVNGSVDRAYFQYLGRHANQPEINFWTAVYNANPNYRTEDLIAAILGSPEYFAKHTTANTPLPSQDQQFADALYTSVLGGTNAAAEQTRDLPFLASAEFNARLSIGQAIVGSQEYRDKLTNFIYQTDLGRAPSAGEFSLWRPIVGTGGAPGGPNGDEQLLEAIFSSPEYFTHQTPDVNNLHTNDTWLRSLYSSLHVPFNPLQEATNLAGLDSAYLTTRLNAVRLFQSSAEYAITLTNNAYQLYLGRSPNAAETTFWISQFQNGETQEQQIASILGSLEYFLRTPTILGLTVQPSPDSFVRAAYLQLFPGYAVSQGEVNFFVNQLNAGTTNNFQIATVLVGSDLYRFGSPNAAIPNNGFIQRAYLQYLGRAITQPEVDALKMAYASNPAFRTVDLLASIFDSNEYLTKTHQFP